jgi:hypothetical protein
MPAFIRFEMEPDAQASFAEIFYPGHCPFVFNCSVAFHGLTRNGNNT